MPDNTEKFAEEIINSWTDFYSQAQAFERKNWIFRGQSQDWCLTTCLERGLLSWGIPLTRGPVIERALVREFNRRLRGEEYLRAKDNKLYSLALMQHHGAPTRLLDCTYSPFVATQMAIKEGKKEKDHAIWCFNSDWMDTHFKRLFGLKKAKEHDKKRTDTTFTSIYNNTKSFVHQENPLLLNERLTIQQGVFLCPGNARQPFQKNLCEMEGWNSRNNLCKLRLVLTHEERAVFGKMLKRMNLNEAALFPGLDGFARSLGEHLRHFNELY